MSYPTWMIFKRV